jgi:hypothetical protein
MSVTRISYLSLISVVSRLVYNSIGHCPKAYALNLNFILNFEAGVLNESLGVYLLSLEIRVSREFLFPVFAVFSIGFNSEE